MKSVIMTLPLKRTILEDDVGDVSTILDEVRACGSAKTVCMKAYAPSIVIRCSDRFFLTLA